MKDAVAESENDSLLRFLYACPIGLIEFDGAGQISMVNPHAMKLLMPLATSTSVDNIFRILEHHAPDLRHVIAEYPADHGTIRADYRVHVDLGETGRSGHPQIFSLALTRIGSNSYVTTLSDISEQVAQEARLSQADAWFSTLFDDVISYALLAVDKSGKVLSANEHFVRQTGRTGDSIVGQRISQILKGDPDRSDWMTAELHAASRDGWILREGWEIRESGERYRCQRLLVARETGIADVPQFGTAYSMVLREVPARNAEASDLVTLLTQDSLTGAANRMSFQKAMRRERSRWSTSHLPTALIMLDLDHFKRINDTHGHPAGDAVLRAVARVGLQKVTPEGLFCRLGGEEFALLVPHITCAAAAALAEELRCEIADLQIGEWDIRVTASLGCADLSEVDGSTEDLIKLADARLYSAKRDGRNRVCSISE